MLRGKLLWPLLVLVVLYTAFHVVVRQSSIIAFATSLTTGLRISMSTKWLERDHIFIPATRDGFELIGRWHSSNDNLGQQAAFLGSRIRFTVQKSTSLYISVGRDPYLQGNSKNYCCDTEHARSGSTAIPTLRAPTLLLITTEARSRLFEYDTDRILNLSLNLSRYTNNIEIVLVATDPKHDSSFCFKGIWLQKGGSIIDQSRSDGHLDRASTSYKAHRRKQEYSHNETITPRTALVEIVAPAHSLAHTIDKSSNGQLIYQAPWTTLLETTSTLNITTTTIPIPADLCLAAKCHTSLLPTPPNLTIADLYFRSSSPTSRLFHTHWSWQFSPRQPDLLILDIGTTDFHTFVTSQPSDQPLTKRALETFMTQFVAAYINFILTIRRTAWHQQYSTQDPVFAYTSAPSSLQIFILTPLLTPSPDPLLTNTLHNALRRVIARLRNEGDINTHLIDTSGWLEPPDIVPDITPSHPSPHRLTDKAHAKIAHFLALHLCPYLTHDPSQCEFDRHDEYAGNLYVPEDVELSRRIEERKIERVKALVRRFE